MLTSHDSVVELLRSLHIPRRVSLLAIVQHWRGLSAPLPVETLPVFSLCDASKGERLFCVCAVCIMMPVPFSFLLSPSFFLSAASLVTRLFRPQHITEHMAIRVYFIRLALGSEKLAD